MIDNNKVKPTHLQRCAYVYVRQSTAAQVEYNRESTQRQYNFVDRAISLGWSKQPGRSGSDHDKFMKFMNKLCV